MKILLDENLPKKLKIDLGESFEVKTVRDLGWQGKKNGELIQLIEINEFNILITLDKNLRYQQNLNKFNFSIFLLVSINNRRQTLQTLIKRVKEKLETGEYKKWNEISF